MFSLPIGFLSILSPPVHAGEVDWSGRIQSDLRYRLEHVPAGAWYAPTGVSKGFERVETIVGGTLETGGDSVLGFVDAQVVAASRQNGLSDLGSLAQRGQVDPLSVELNEAFFEIWDAVVPGLDLRVGHQLVQWGVGDQFNPTNNLNADDLEDPLQFGKQLPNTMVRADYALGPMWTLSGVVVPIFRSAMLPTTSSIGVAFTDRIPVVEDDVRLQLQAEQALARDSFGYPTIVSQTTVLEPANDLAGMARMVRLGGAIGMQDIALSWYTGRSDIPIPAGNHTRLARKTICHPENGSDCIKGYMLTEASLAYPRMHVAGLNMAGEVNALGWVGASPIGWRAEAALVMPERMTIKLTNDELPIDPSLVQRAGEYDYDLAGERPTVVEDVPFAKWTIGLDYTLGKNIYLNGQWVHGMTDEFGSGDFIRPGFTTRVGRADSEIRRLRIGDYGVLGADIGLGLGTLRLFSLFDLTGYQTETQTDESSDRAVSKHGPFSADGFSAVLYPELMFRLGDGLSAAVGTIQMFGKSHTKFGDPAAGGDLAFVRGSYDF